MKKIFAMLAMMGYVNAVEATPVEGETFDTREKDISKREYDLLALGAKQAPPIGAMFEYSAGQSHTRGS